MRATVLFELPDGAQVELGHGDLIGRLWSAALQLDDARISEAHAMLSLRGDSFRLLALRGRMAVDGKPATAVELTEGLQVHLARELSLRVLEISLPTRVLGVQAPGLPLQALHGVCSIKGGPRPELLPRYARDADAHIWSDGAHWLLQIAGQEQRIELKVGSTWELAGVPFSAQAIELSQATPDATRQAGQLRTPLTLVANYDSVHIQREGEAPLALSGLAARILSELVAFDGPVDWQILANEVWPDEDDPHLLRRRLDVTLARMRKKLREHGLRKDLVRADGLGHLELFMYEGDQVEDRT